ncbi:MAG: GyrI-like domain-containing protein [Acidobacteriota bacterium]|nr:GyrI-like domain-containing protein [Acidobacteriota bacterium]
MIKPKLVSRDEMKIIGVEARTINRAEADPLTAKIPALWGRFFQFEDRIPNKTNNDAILGTYTDYESDHNGEYSLIVSSQVSDLNDVPDGMVGATIPSGKYLVFTAEGQMPAALIGTWADIWQHFSDNTEHERAYTTDFELHERNNQSRVDVYIAIK